MTQERDRILTTLRSELPRLREAYGLARLGLFGSMARDQAGPQSDVDILVEYERVPTLFEMGRLKAELEELLGQPVDLVHPSGLGPRTLERVRGDAVPV